MHHDVRSPDSAGHCASNHKNLVGKCNVPIDPLGLHALCCKRGGHVQHRHDLVRDVLARCLETVGARNVLVEQISPAFEDSTVDVASLRPDLNYVNFKSRRVHVDVEICTMHAARANSSARSGALIEHLEGVKRRKYSHLRLLPFVTSHLGRFGHSAQTIIKSTCTERDVAARSKSIAHFHQSIACAVQHGNASIIAAAGHVDKTWL